METVTDSRILRDVFAAKGLCTGCGACVSVCQILGNNVLLFDPVKGSLRSDITKETCKHCGLCYAVCPRKNYLGNAAQTPIETENYIGNYLKFEILRSKDLDLQTRTKDGGFVPSLLKSLMDMNYIDGAIISTVGDNWSVNSNVTHTSDELINSLGNSYSVSPFIVFVDKVNEEKLENQFAGYNDKKYAFVGQPCMVTAITNMRKYNLEIARKIRLTIGLYCFERMNYQEITSKLEEKTGTKIDSWEKVSQKGKFVVQFKGGENPIEVPLQEIGDLVRQSCRVCLDLTNLDADISTGTLGAPKGYASVVIRTKAGQDAINVANRRGLLEGIPELGPAAKNVYAKALKTLIGVAHKKCCTVNLRRWEELTKEPTPSP